MAISTEHYVYLKLQAHDTSHGIGINTIPLKVVSVAVATDKSIPAFPIPFSGAFTGESLTVALDLGMSNKTLGLTGTITGDEITKKFGDTVITREFTAQEIAQMIASGVDSTGLAKFQAFNELVVLIPSKVDENYNQRASTVNIPFTFAARGDSMELDNTRVPLSSNFPTSETSKGVKGFISNFNYTMTAESLDIEFTLDFRVALIIP
jgi:hypothetical protein